MGVFDLFGSKPLPSKHPNAVPEVVQQAQPITINPRLSNQATRQAARLHRLYQTADTKEILEAREVCKIKLKLFGHKRPPRNLAEAAKLDEELRNPSPPKEA